MTAMELRPDSQGKVRDIYDAGDSLLMVASDRISAFDYILPDEIPYKGEVLSRISAFWFEKLADVVPNHLVSMDPHDFPAEFLPYEEYLSGRAMLVRKAEPIKIECVVRGYLTGSIKEAYDATGEVDGIALPAGLVEASPLPEPLFTPSTKADVGDHDENISYERCVELIGEDLASQIRDLSISLYTEASSYARTRGIIIADTKFEFGLDEEGNIVLGDEMLTPDSSRFWPAEGYEPGHGQPSFDKQFARDWLKANPDNDWTLPQEIVDKTIDKYLQAYEMLTGEKLK